MPEMPEVETIRRGLTACLTELIVSNLHVLNQSSIETNKEFNTIKQIKQAIIGQQVTGIGRFGKLLVLDFCNGICLTIHLKMTGQLVFVSSKKRFGGGHPTDSLITKLPDSSTRVIFEFSTNKERVDQLNTNTGSLFFNDQRKFGRISLYKSSSIAKIPFIKNLGPQPPIIKQGQDVIKEVSDNKELLEKFICNLQKHPKIAIKAALLDQHIVSGIGNIYADESLFASGIHPESKVGSLSAIELEKIWVAASEVMSLAIALGGSTDKNYVDTNGNKGNYLTFAKVFRKEGLACHRCGAIIVKIKVSGRGTHICQNCQILYT